MKIDFSKFSSIKMGRCVEVRVIDEDNFNGEFIIGRATNTLVVRGDNLGILDKRYNFIEVKKGYLRVGAKTQNRRLYSFCRRNNIKGFEFLAKLPGSVGGSVRMNAGVKSEEIGKRVVAIKTLSGWREDVEFWYRGSDIDEPVFEVLFELESGFDYGLDLYLKNLRSNQPSEPSLGSVFKNPKGDFAARLIEAVGMKGLRKGGVEVSKKHANFFVNVGGGKCEEMLFLINEAKKRVFNEFGIELKEEIIIV
jgi:UDP-N-acetylmuramate dehydrogenase